MVTGKRVLVVEDGPTLTHGGMKIGAGDGGRPQATGRPNSSIPAPTWWARLRETFAIYPGIGTVLPAMGYGAEQLADLEATINATDCDAVVIGTPIDLGRVIEHPQAPHPGLLRPAGDRQPPPGRAPRGVPGTPGLG